MQRRCSLFLALLVFAVGATSRAQNSELGLVNLDASKIPALAAAAGEAGLTPITRAADEAVNSRVVVWQAENKPAFDITDARAQKLEAWLKEGGSLLITLAPTPGKGVFRLSSVLPTKAWHTASQHKVVRGASRIAQSDTAFFGSEISGEVPFSFEMRPFHAVERGQGRYEQFASPLNKLEVVRQLPAGNDWWTRPLLNRDWQIRLRGDDFAQTPLLITGRYGAGKVAIWASSADALGDSPSARAMWKGVLTWLGEKPGATTPDVTNYPVPATQIDAAKRVLRVTLQNPTNAALPLQVVARILTWEGAIIGDQLLEANIAANGSASREIILPPVNATAYQALDYRDAFIVRVGVLSGDGRKLWSEQRLPVDLQPALRLAVQTEEERARTYPFNAAPPGKGFRLGTQIPAYSYQPGATVNAQVVLSNGLVNLAPEARISDENAPQNATVMALSDGAQSSEKGPIQDIQAYGAWEGEAKKDHVLKWEWPTPVTIAAVVLSGAGDTFRNRNAFNPPVIIIEADGKEVARESNGDSRWMETQGRLRLEFAPVTTRVLRVKLPWVAKTAQGNPRNQATISLGEVEIEGAHDGSGIKPVSGILTVTLVDALNGKTQPVNTRTVEVTPLARQVVALPVVLPNDGKSARFWRIEAKFAAQNSAPLTQSAPLMSLEPQKPLLPMTAFNPPDAIGSGFIVTRGFRNILDNAIGTAQDLGGWGQPEDLVWAYAHGFKQNGTRLRTRTGILFVSENDMRHYSTQWRQFYNGEEFYTAMTPFLVQRLKEHRNWDTSDTVVLGHSDRWDTGPQVGSQNSWQSYEGFNDYLKKEGGKGLEARTLETIANEITEKYPHQWQAWHLERYVNSVRTLREAFAKEGKQLVITAQGVPLVPPAYEAELSKVIKGSSDDITWGMDAEDVPLTTGRQMGLLAFNPTWDMSTLIQWGWDSGELNNPQWKAPVGTTEASRRHLYDRAFRGLVRRDGSYTSMQTYGYNTNGGYSFTMTPNDFQQWNEVQERHTLLTPDGPIGAGLVLSNSRLNDPKMTAFDGAMGYNQPGLEGVRWTQTALQRLHQGGLSVPFSANANSLGTWKGTAPLIAVNLWEWSADEVAALKALSERNVPIAALGMPAGQKLSAPAAALFGVTPEGAPAAGKPIAKVAGRDVIATGNRVFVPVFAGDMTAEIGNALAPILRDRLNVPLQFPSGAAGYGFVSNGRRLAVVEDWREEGRIAPLRVRSDAANLRAVNVNDHTPLTTRRDGADWLIEVPLRPGDAVLVAMEETR